MAENMADVYCETDLFWQSCKDLAREVLEEKKVKPLKHGHKNKRN